MRARPACLKTNLSDEDRNIKLTVTGWGRVSKDRMFISSYLLKF